MKRIGLALSITGLLLASMGGIAQASQGNADNVTICHRTASASGGNQHNGYDLITVDPDSIIKHNGHDSHEQIGNGPGGDLIPPFHYDFNAHNHHYVGDYPGKGNWALIATGCAPAQEVTTSSTASPTTVTTATTLPEETTFLPTSTTLPELTSTTTVPGETSTTLGTVTTVLPTSTTLPETTTSVSGTPTTKSVMTSTVPASSTTSPKLGTTSPGNGTGTPGTPEQLAFTGSDVNWLLFAAGWCLGIGLVIMFFAGLARSKR